LGEGARLEPDLPLADGRLVSRRRQLVIENSLAETNYLRICCNCELQARVVQHGVASWTVHLNSSAMA
jgi:hypothetical protein